jgi:hypothetical protein
MPVRRHPADVGLHIGPMERTVALWPMWGRSMMEARAVDDEPGAQDLQDAAAMWAVDQFGAEEIIDLAVDLLVAGVDTPSLRVLAGVPKVDAPMEVPDLLEATLAELGLAFFERGSLPAKVAAARVMAHYVDIGALGPREFVRWMHAAIGHRGHREAGDLEVFASLADSYDTAEYSNVPSEDLDRLVLAAIKDLLDPPD